MEAGETVSGSLQAGAEVVQVIMQDDGQIVMPDGQFIQLSSDGQTQYIQVTGEDGQNQLIQLTPDGEAQLVQFADPTDSSQVLHIANSTDPNQLIQVSGHDPNQVFQVMDGTDPTSHIMQIPEGQDSDQAIQITGTHDTSEVFQVAAMPNQTSSVIGVDPEDDPQHLVPVSEAQETSQIINVTPDAESSEVLQFEGTNTGTTLLPVSISNGLDTGLTLNGTQTLNEPIQPVAQISSTTPETSIEEQNSPHVDQISEDTEGSLPMPLIKPETETTITITTAPVGSSATSSEVVDSSQIVEASSAENVEETSTPAIIQADTPEEPSAGREEPLSKQAEPPKARKIIDTQCPISLTSETTVIVDGKKCVLRVDPKTNHLVAYPYKPEPVPGKRMRGRPRKIRPEDQPPGTVPVSSASSSSTSQSSESNVLDQSRTSPQCTCTLSEQENSAAEGLLGLSDTGPDGRRRSTRVKKKNKLLTEYETGAIEGVEEEEDSGENPDLDEEPAKRGRGRPPKNLGVSSKLPSSNPVQSLLMSMGYLPMKRGRGRPRRNPLPGQSSSGPIPAFIIPSPGGQAVMMAPVQNLSQLQALQRGQSSQSLVAIKPKPSGSLAEEQPPIIIENSDGTQTHIFPPKAAPDDDLPEETNPEDEAAVNALSQGLDDDDDVNDGADDEENNTTTNDSIDTADGLVESIKEVDDESCDKESSPSKATGNPALPPAAIIQLPQNLVPLLLPKKEPVKIGLKATESELEKLKCPKCDFQAYYLQQYQDHITVHIDDIHKCKCCMFHTFDPDELLEHFREAHPKCICSECDFMAEHAYIIKRHMMRHSTQGCECEICGKKYKDQYILKMHVKMVHMPAEVLFECNICSKKFTRKAHLKRHLRIHEPEKPFKCPHCEYRGCERSDISKHVLIHEAPKHVCEVCGKAFRHIKNKELHVKRHKGQRDYKCGVCDFYGYTFTDIRKHIERRHSDVKNILCDKCGSAFKSDLLLREHQKGHCDMMLIEHALATAENQGSATIQIPTDHYGPEGQIMIDSNQVNITVEQVTLTDEGGVHLTESQLVEGQLTEAQLAEAQAMAVSQATAMGDMDFHTIAVAAGQEVEMEDEEFEEEEEEVGIVEGVEEDVVEDVIGVEGGVIEDPSDGVVTMEAGVEMVVQDGHLVEAPLDEEEDMDHQTSIITMAQ